MSIKHVILLNAAAIALASTLIFTGARSALADGVRDNDPAKVRAIPPVGNDLEPADRQSLQAGVDALEHEIESLRGQLKDQPLLLAYLPDVEIYYNAVEYPLVHHETIEPGMARKAIDDGMQRARELRDGRTPWTMITGPRGYVSRIDGSVQPYILGIPADYKPAPADKPAKPYRLDVWGHGRDEMLTELRFVEMDDYLHELKYLNLPAEPQNKLILSIYGRYITAYRFAGEIDGLEAIAAVKRMYPVDPNRMLIIGFSLGGTMSWQYGTHFPDLWAAAAPGAGLAETKEFLKGFQKEDVSAAPWYEQVLWHLYDSTDDVVNLSNLPVIAYAGELDPQKQASDMMLKAATAEHVKIDRIVGKEIGHHFTLEAMQKLNQRLDKIIDAGSNPLPPKIRFTTWTLRYNHVDWLTVNALEHHWQQGRVEGTRGETGFSLSTRNVNSLSLDISAEHSDLAAGREMAVTLDGQRIDGGVVGADRAYSASFSREGGNWHRQNDAASPVAPGLRKRHGLQGPIDDAFMDSFVVVRPTGKPLNEKTGAWESAECKHCIEHWFKQFRGEARVKDDSELTDADIANSNLVLFGDPSSNRLLARIEGKLPIRWNGDSISLGARTFSADHHVPVLIYPNPLNPSRYVVLNSGFTYREYDYLNNARQTPKLPDFAVIDVSIPATTQSPGGVAAAGFFDEQWRLQADDGRAAAGWNAEQR